MVPVITYHLKQWWSLFVIILCLCVPLHGNFWDDAFGALKTATNKVGNAFEDAGKEIAKGANTAVNAIKERFTDTKTTRAIDYGIQKAAFETALATATGVLEVAKQASTGTLIAAEETAKAGLSAAEHFLSDVVAVVSPAILKTSAQAAQGALEGVKQAGVGVLKGTQWVVNQVADFVDINHIRYQGDLKSLERGMLGNVLCEGSAFKQPFSVRFDLDPGDLSSVQKSIEKILKDFERLFNEKVANPIVKAFTPLQQQVRVVEKALATPPPANPAIVQAIEASKKASDLMQHLSTQEQAAIENLKAATAKLQEFAQKKTDELKSLISKGTTQSSSNSARAREELIKRLKNKTS